MLIQLRVPVPHHAPLQLTLFLWPNLSLNSLRQAGDEVGQILRRGFFIELQSRFGNLFYVREEVHFVLAELWLSDAKISTYRLLRLQRFAIDRRCLYASKIRHPQA